MSESDENLRIVGANVRAARDNAGLTQECLAELIGVDPQTVSNIERGIYPAGALIIAALAQHLSVSADEFFVGLPPIDRKRAAKIRKALARKRSPRKK